MIIDRELGRAISVLEAALDQLRLTGTPDELGAQQQAQRTRLQRRLLRRWLIVGLLGTGTVLIAVGLALFGILAILTAGLIALGALLFWFVGWLSSYYRFQKALFQLDHKLHEGVTARAQAMDDAANAALELNRLASLYVQYIDWAEIIGWLIHHPFGDDEDQRALDSSRLDPVTLPNALCITTAKAPALRLSGLTHILEHQVFRHGWLSSAYAALEEREMTRLQAERGLSGLRVVITPDIETERLSRGARTRLLERLGAVDTHRETRELALAEVREFCRDQQLDDVFDNVEPLSDLDLRPERSEEVSTFLRRALPTRIGDPLQAETFSDAAIARDDSLVTSSFVWGPPAFVNAWENPDPDRIRAYAVPSRVTREGGTVFAVVRSDCTKRLPLEQFSLIAVDTPEREVSIYDDGEPDI